MNKISTEEKRLKINELMKKEGNSGLRKLIENKCGAKVADTTLYRMCEGAKTSENTLHFVYYILTH
ncbi:hypothetical protein [Vibrio alginolyticus]|uniref:hypothetical protein n=1 Tax=Vibrio alginolyticus TaxID=663 RepID=UPI0007200DB3|nr:hypothetical protein [Vibrio alginolyticus]ALR91692.1 hypothetical protein AT730_04525 [Vibrio alginolyticus]MBY7710557.1 hypothetical protein [Vibrio alginolyticus]